MNLKKSLFLAALGTITLGGAGKSRAFLLTNGNFDRTHAVEIVPNFFLPQPNNWTNQGSRAITGPYFDDLSSEPWAGPAPTPATTDGNLNGPFPNGFDGPDGGVFFKAFSGNTTTNGAATAHLYQDVSAAPGIQYTLTGWAGAEPNYLADQTLFALDFLNAGNSVISTVSLDLEAAGLFTPNGQPFNYKQYMIFGIAPANTVMVRARVSMIGGIGNPAGGGQAFVVDDFVLVPEPSVAGMAIVSLLGILGRRKR